jgi:hypothetical protein
MCACIRLCVAYADATDPDPGAYSDMPVPRTRSSRVPSPSPAERIGTCHMRGAPRRAGRRCCRRDRTRRRRQALLGAGRGGREAGEKVWGKKPELVAEGGVKQVQERWRSEGTCVRAKLMSLAAGGELKCTPLLQTSCQPWASGARRWCAACECVREWSAGGAFGRCAACGCAREWSAGGVRRCCVACEYLLPHCACALVIV